MTIPTYKANVGQYNVPSMNNAGEQANNNLIFEGLASFNKAITKTAIDMYENEKEYEAAAQGAADVESGKVNSKNIGDLPAPTTYAQKAYNQAAIDYYANSFNLETSQGLDKLATANKHNAAAFLSASDSYLKGVSENIPAHLKSKILYPLQVKAQSSYNTILKQQLADQETYMSEQAKFNVGTLVNDIANLDFATTDDSELKSNNIQVATAINMVKSLVGKPGGITAQYAMDQIDALNKGVAFSYINNKMKNLDASPEEAQKIIDDFVAGRTNNTQINKLSPAVRAELASFTISEQVKLDGQYKRVSELNVYKAENKIQQAQMDFIQEYHDYPMMDAETRNLRKQNMLDLAATPSQTKAIEDFFSTDIIQTDAFTKTELDKKLQDGTIEYEDVIAAKTQKRLSNADFESYVREINSPLVQNKKRDAYKVVSEQINHMYPNIINDHSFEIKGTNNKRIFVESSMDMFLASKPRTDEEIYKFFDDLQRRATGVEGGKYRTIPTSIADRFNFKLPTFDFETMRSRYAPEKTVINGKNKETSYEIDYNTTFNDMKISNPEMSDEQAKINTNELLSWLEPEIKALKQGE